MGSYPKPAPWRVDSTFLAGDAVWEPAGSCGCFPQHSTGIDPPAGWDGVLGCPAPAWEGKICHCRANTPPGKLQGWCCGTLDSPAGAYPASTEHPSGQTLATGSCAIWSYSEKPKEFFLPCYKNLHSFLWAKQAGFLLVWILWLSCAICQEVCLPGKEQLPLIVLPENHSYELSTKAAFWQLPRLP